MKREGRQHGLVRSYRIMPSPWNPRPGSRVVNRFDSPPKAGLFTKVSPKPTNHSKFTGKCARPGCVECHLNPTSKSKNKGKGAQRLRSCDVVSNYRLVDCGVVNMNPGSDLAGVSASRILDQLEDDYDCVDEEYKGSCDLVYDGPMVEFEVALGAVDNDRDGGQNDERSFCDVAPVWEQVDEADGWCLVGDM